MTADVRARWLYALHSHLPQIPILAGQTSYHLNALLGPRRRLIEHKRATWDDGVIRGSFGEQHCPGEPAYR